MDAAEPEKASPGVPVGISKVGSRLGSIRLCLHVRAKGRLFKAKAPRHVAITGQWRPVCGGACFCHYKCFIWMFLLFSPQASASGCCGDGGRNYIQTVISDKNEAAILQNNSLKLKNGPKWSRSQADTSLNLA